ncbi:NAD(P)H-binding protein [Actinomadura gamaensis]|uniref:NAD(P)H-binding protein n=1 Tax=Actinomadura gamaensis TaxID=1763541 RepID=A0ABV9TWH1_9ACTN
MILVTGATGNVGGEVARALSAAGARVRALVRDTSDTPDIPNVLPADVECVTGDLDDPTCFATVLRQANGLFLLPGFGHTAELLAEAAVAGVERVVLLSGPSAGSGDLTNAVTRSMVESETLVRASGLEWTILRPSGFMSNALEWVPQLAAGDVVRAPFADVAVACVDPSDIAAVATLALLEDGQGGLVHRLTGPEALRPADRLRILAQVLGRDLRFEPQPDDEARAEMAQEMPAEYVDAFFDFYAAGALDDSHINNTIRNLTGRAPRSFEQWATAHAEAFPHP